MIKCSDTSWTVIHFVCCFLSFSQWPMSSDKLGSRELAIVETECDSM